MLKSVFAFVAGICCVVLLTPLVAIFAPTVIPRIESDGLRARVDVRTIGSAARLHFKKHGRYPTSNEGIEGLVEANVLSRLPIDEWGRPYEYTLIDRDGHECVLIGSFGEDGIAGGGGPNADVYEFFCHDPRMLMDLTPCAGVSGLESSA